MAGIKTQRRGTSWRRRLVLIVLGCVVATTLAGLAYAFDPTFAPAAGSPFAVGTNPHSVAVADFNRDGIVDLATSNVGSNNVAILLGLGNGVFGAASFVPVGSEPHSLAAADFNQDGKPDLTVANSSSDTLSILLGDGAGGFTPAPSVIAGDGPWFIAVADLNHDGKRDLAVSNLFTNDVSILLGDGAGGFNAAAAVPVGNVPYGIAVADLNRDRKLDLASRTNTPRPSRSCSGAGTVPSARPALRSPSAADHPGWPPTT